MSAIVEDRRELPAQQLGEVESSNENTDDMDDTPILQRGDDMVVLNANAVDAFREEEEEEQSHVDSVRGNDATQRQNNLGPSPTTIRSAPTAAAV